VLIALGTMLVGIVFVPDLVKEVDLVPACEEGDGYTMDRSIPPNAKASALFPWCMMNKKTVPTS